MTQNPENKKLAPELLQSIDPRGIADPSVRQTIEILLNLIEEQNLKIKSLEQENQKLRDENNRLKGEKGKPDIKANKTSGFKKDHSSEKERKTPSKHTKSSKNVNIKIDKERILDYPQSDLPSDAEFKGYEDVIIQDISLQTDNILFRKRKYYSEKEGKTYLAPLPEGYDGEFGPGIKALVMSLYYGGNMTQGKLLEFLEDIGISMSAGYLSNLLIKNTVDFEAEFNELYIEGLASTDWQHLDQTSARVILLEINVFRSISFCHVKKNYFVCQGKCSLKLIRSSNLKLATFHIGCVQLYCKKFCVVKVLRSHIVLLKNAL